MTNNIRKEQIERRPHANRERTDVSNKGGRGVIATNGNEKRARQKRGQVSPGEQENLRITNCKSFVVSTRITVSDIVILETPPRADVAVDRGNKHMRISKSKQRKAKET